jgi:class 3 adenylate cyclase
MRSPAAHNGAERKLVTVLFADVDQNGEQYGERDPEDVGRALTGQLDEIRLHVERFGGGVEHTLGGRVVAAFGIPRTRADDPERAVRAALSIREAFAGGRETPPKARVQLAVATGEALVRSSGNGQRVTGELLTTCGRLLETTPPGGVLVSQATMHATERVIAYGPATLVGLAGGTTMQAWSALEPRISIEPRAGMLRLPPMVAREQELTVLLDRFAEVREGGPARLVALVGDPGIGKTRLVSEFASRLSGELEPVAWRQGRSPPYGDGVTYWALSEIVKAEAGILETDSAEQAESKLAGAVLEVVPEPGAAAWVARHLRPLVGVAGTQHGPGSPSTREEAFAAWRRFLYGLAERRPLVLVIEELHRADDGMLEFLEDLVTQGPGRPTPLLVVGTARPELFERRPGWGGRRLEGAAGVEAAERSAQEGIELLWLRPLSDGDTQRLLTGLLSRHGLPGNVGTRLVGRVAGNPLFAEEYVRMLRDRGVGAEEPPPGSGPAARRSLPATVHAIVAARLDALPPDEKAVLQDAAVLGQVGWLGALAAIGDRDRPRLQSSLERLERKEYIVRAERSRVAGEIEYAFHHLIVRDVAYGQIVRASRAEKHLRAATWIEALAPGRAEDRAELLAHHYQAALSFARAAGQATDSLVEQARGALRDAGDRAAALGADGRAASYFAQALELSRPDDPDRAELLLRLGRARCQEEGGGGEALAAARDGLLDAGKRVQAAEAEMLLGELAFLHGRGEQRAAHSERARTLVADAAPSRPKAAVLRGCMLHLVIANRHAEARHLAEEVLALAATLGLRDMAADAHGTIGLARVDAGDTGGIAELEQAIAILESSGSPGAIVWQLNLAYAFAALGDLGAFTGALDASWRTAERFGSLRRLRSIRLQRVAQQFWTGRWHEAVRTVDALVAGTVAGQRHYLEWECRMWRGRIRLAQGANGPALQDAAVALELAREAADPQGLNPTRAFNARTLLATGRRDAAAALTDELLAGLGGSVLGADLGVDLGVVLAGLGYPVAALDARGIPPSPWLEAARAFVAGQPARAAELYAAIGSRPDEAYARLEAARQALEDGRAGEVGSNAAVAAAFYRKVGASTLLREAELLASNATAR